MSNKNTLKPGVNLIKFTLFRHRMLLFISLAIFWAMLMTLSALHVDSYLFSFGFHDIFFLIYLFLGGSLVASICFSGYHRRESAHFWLLLPVSLRLKFALPLISTFIVFPVFAFISYSLFYIMSEGFNYLIFGEIHSFMLIPEIFKSYPAYLGTISIFFLGAVFFRKYHFLKTVASGVILYVAIILLLLAFLNLSFIGADYVRQDYISRFEFGGVELAPVIFFIEPVATPLIEIVKNFWWLFLFPSMTSLAALRFLEIEEHYAV